MGVKNNRQHAAEKAAVESSAGLKRRHAENFAGIGDVIIPGAENQPDFRDDHRGENDIDAEIPDIFGIEPARGAWRLAYQMPSSTPAATSTP